MATYYWVASSPGTWDSTTTTPWSLSSGGAGSAGVPTATDNVIFNTAADVTLVNTGAAKCNNFTITGAGIAGFSGNGGISIYGNVSLTPTTTIASTGSLLLYGTAGNTFSQNGATITVAAVQVNGTGTYTLGSALACGSVYINAGGLNTGGFNVTCTTLSSSNTTTRTISLAGSTVTISTINFLDTTGLTFNCGTSTINVSGASLASGGLTFYNVTKTNTSTLTISGNNTFNNIGSTASAATTIKFTSGTTQTVANFTAAGAAGKVLTLSSTTAGSAATMTKSGGGGVMVDYMSIRDSTVVGVSWFPGANSTNVSNNSGWIWPTARLSSSSTFAIATNIAFDEVTTSTARIAQSGIFSSTFDEVTMTSGSIYFNGTTQYLTVPSNAALNLSTGDFTIEAWVYHTAAGGDSFIVSAASSGGLFFGFSTSGTLLGYGRAAVAWDYATAHGMSLNTWYHVALTRSGTSIKILVNGIQIGTTQTSSQSYDLSVTSTTIGSQGANFYYSGYISNLRVVKGTAVYTSNFTPPRQPLPPTTTTSLLLNNYYFQPFTDSSANVFPTTLTAAPTFSTLTPFSTSSMRISSSTTIQVYGTFDEVTGIS